MKHHHRHIGLLVIAFATTIVVYGLYLFMYQRVTGSLNSALAAREKVTIEQLSKDQEKNVTILYDATSKDRAKLGNYFVPDSDKIAFIETLEALGTHTGAKVTLSSITDDLAGAKEGKIGHITAHFDVVGTWSTVMRTLIYVENMQYQSSVNTVRLATSGMTDSKNPNQLWNLAFTLDTLAVHVIPK